MISRAGSFFRHLAVALTLAATLLTAAPSVFAGNQLAGSWTLRITIPESPDSATTRTFIVTLDVSPRGESLHGRANITDEGQRTVGAAWRQVGKNVSIAYELPCPGDSPCASLILQGRVKGGGVLIKKGSVIVLWDTANNKNPALYDTSNGTFRGDRLP
ncbi:MAG: hypothetical protein AABN34_07725 [Acidobacteriota bacterium]